jgi:glycosyltransferase involved in cell wall biosynthesis
LRSRPVLRATAEAFAELRREGHDCLFMVIGSGRGESFLRREVARLGLRREVTFADEQFSSQLGKIIMAADVFVSPDPPEGIDLGSLMAMASGVPVVAGRGEDGFVVPGRTAILCDPTSARQLAAAIMGLLDDHASARALAESALEYCRDEHSPSAMVGQVARIYRQAASGHAG